MQGSALLSHTTPVARVCNACMPGVGAPSVVGAVFFPHPNLVSRCYQLEMQVMENSRGPLKQGCFTPVRSLPAQGEVGISQPARCSRAGLVYLSLPRSNYQRKHDVTVPCTPVGDTRVKSRLLETVPQKEDLKELVRSLPAAFISDSRNENARYHRKESFPLSMLCLLVCFYAIGVRLVGQIAEGFDPLCSIVSPPSLAQMQRKGKYSSSHVLLCVLVLARLSSLKS